MRIRDFLGAPEAVGQALTALAVTAPGALLYAASPERAARMGLWVSGEVGGIALGLLDGGEQATHVPAWMLAQHDELAAEPVRRTGSAAGRAGRIPVILFAEGGDSDGSGVITQWAVVQQVRAYRN